MASDMTNKFVLSIMIIGIFKQFLSYLKPDSVFFKHKLFFLSFLKIMLFIEIYL